jgi:hypothetical protein
MPIQLTLSATSLSTAGSRNTNRYATLHRGSNWGGHRQPLQLLSLGNRRI